MVTMFLQMASRLQMASLLQMASRLIGMKNNSKTGRCSNEECPKLLA